MTKKVITCVIVAVISTIMGCQDKDIIVIGYATVTLNENYNGKMSLSTEREIWTGILRAITMHEILLYGPVSDGEKEEGVISNK